MPGSCHTPHTWSVFVSCTSVFCVLAGTWKIASSCTHPPQTGIVACGREFEGASSKWANLVYLSAICALAASAQTCIHRCCRLGGSRRQSGACSILFAIVSAIILTVYTYAAHESFRGVSTTPLNSDGERACVVCTETNNRFANALLWTGVAVAWAGVAIVVGVAAVYIADERPSSPHHEKLVEHGAASRARREFAAANLRDPYGPGDVELETLDHNSASSA